MENFILFFTRNGVTIKIERPNTHYTYLYVFVYKWFQLKRESTVLSFIIIIVPPRYIWKDMTKAEHWFEERVQCTVRTGRTVCIPEMKRTWDLSVMTNANLKMTSSSDKTVIRFYVQYYRSNYKARIDAARVRIHCRE